MAVVVVIGLYVVIVEMGPRTVLDTVGVGRERHWHAEDRALGEGRRVFKHASGYGFVASTSRFCCNLVFGTTVVVVVEVVMVEVIVAREVVLVLRVLVWIFVVVATVVRMVL